MKHCAKCNVSVRGNLTKCPLCEGGLTGADEPRVYPEIKTTYRQYEKFFRIILLSGIAAGTLSVAVNLMLPETGRWSLYVILGVICFWICLYTGVRKKNNIPQNITNQTLFVTILSLIWDWVTDWRGWSVNFVIPITCVVAMGVMATVTQILKIQTEDMIFWLAINAFFGILPVIFMLTGLVVYPIPSLICISSSIIGLAAVLLFQWRDIRREFIKRFHI